MRAQSRVTQHATETQESTCHAGAPHVTGCWCALGRGSLAREGPGSLDSKLTEFWPGRDGGEHCRCERQAESALNVRRGLRLCLAGSGAQAVWGRWRTREADHAQTRTGPQVTRNLFAKSSKQPEQSTLRSARAASPHAHISCTNTQVPDVVSVASVFAARVESRKGVRIFAIAQPPPKSLHGEAPLSVGGEQRKRPPRASRGGAQEPVVGVANGCRASKRRDPLGLVSEALSGRANLHHTQGVQGVPVDSVRPRQRGISSAAAAAQLSTEPLAAGGCSPGLRTWA